MSVEAEENARYRRWTGFLLFACVVCLVFIVLFGTGAIEVTKKKDVANPKYKITISVSHVEVGGTTYHKIRMSNTNGMSVELLDYGGTIQSLEVPDRTGNIDDVTLGFSSVADYFAKTYFGALIGRFANRLANGTFSLDGVFYNVTLNEGSPPKRHLHGGTKGWDQVQFQFTIGEDYVVFYHVSKDGDQGFPGEVKFNARVRLTYDNQLQFELRANTTKPTPINLTTHPFFNLKGHSKGPITGHNVAIFADHWLEVTDELIPTGRIVDVSNSVFDLRRSRPLTEVIWNVSDNFLGFDHNFCLRGPTGTRLAARVSEPTSGRVMEVFTNQPGLQFYTGFFLNYTSAKDGATYASLSGFAMEPQNYPDAPNHDNFPDSILRPGSTYLNFISYKFSVY